MKRVIILLTLLILTSFFGYAQIETYDYIAPFQKKFSAVKKDNKWGFINDEGIIAINFRDDLVTTKTNDGEYPVFSNGKCLVVKKESGISYFGYIDTSGKTIIKPVFLNATNFKNKKAIVLKLNKETRGYNNVLGKKIVYYTYVEVIIDEYGEIKEHLTAPTNIVLVKGMFKGVPKIGSKFLSEKLIATKSKDQKWTIKRISN